MEFDHILGSTNQFTGKTNFYWFLRIKQQNFAKENPFKNHNFCDHFQKSSRFANNCYKMNHNTIQKLIRCVLIYASNSIVFILLELINFDFCRNFKYLFGSESD